MPIDKITAPQFATQIATGINSRNSLIDTTFGPVPDASINPQAAVFESQNDRIRLLSLFLSLVDPTVFTGYDTDLEGIVFNEGLLRILGSAAAAVCVFARKTPPPVNAVVQMGFPIGSAPDTATGTTVTFVTTASAVLPPLPTAEGYFNTTTQQFEVAVPVVALIPGSLTRVGPNQITRPLRTLGSFDSVTNPEAAAGGRDKETNAALVERYLLAILGRQTGTSAGIIRVARAGYAGVESLYNVFGTNPLLVRAATDAGAVDSWVKGAVPLQIKENHIFYGAGQLIPVNAPPLIQVVSVQSGGVTYAESTDYDVTSDVTGWGRSTRESAGVTFRAGVSLPAVGDVVSITYTYDSLIGSLQTGFQQPSTLELGRDLLFRRGIDTPIVHSAVLSVLPGFSTSSVLAAVQTAVLSFVNGLGMGESVEGSDIQRVVRALSGVGNYVITRLTLSTVPFGTADVVLGGNLFPSLAPADLSITPST